MWVRIAAGYPVWHEPEPLALYRKRAGSRSTGGMRSAREVRGARQTIELCRPQLPPADAIVNPNLEGDGFASKALAGVGVIFYVLLALRRRFLGPVIAVMILSLNANGCGARVLVLSWLSVLPNMAVAWESSAGWWSGRRGGYMASASCACGPMSIM